MGYYINPVNMSKEEWLIKNGHIIGSLAPSRNEYDDQMAVVLVDNYAFTAAAIAYSQMELEEFASPHDKRPKCWYWVPKKLLEEFM